MTTRLYYASDTTPLGWVLVAQNDSDEVTNICLADTKLEAEQELRDRHPTTALSPGNSVSLLNALQRLVNFLVDPGVGLDIPVKLRGTEFQREVWRALCKIPVGETNTYADVATQLGDRNAVRAVAQACRANSLAILVPCHRVIKSDGSLSGYRWGDERKQRLLELEEQARVRQLSDKPRSSAFAREEGPVHVVPMSVIRRPMPSELDEDKVQSFMDEMSQGDVFTPIEIVKVRSKLKSDPAGPIHNFYFSLGGCHRYEATKRLGLPTIRARIIEAPASHIRVYLGAGSPF